MKARRSAGRLQKASHIAAKIARGVVYLSQDPRHASLMPPEAGSSVERFALAAGILRPWMVRLLSSPGYHRILDGLMERFWPGELMHFTLRKRFMDDEARAALAGPATQMLVLGAGFDTLGMRMAKAFPAATVVEIEAPPTAERRRRAFEAIGEVHENLQTVGADLSTEPLSAALERTGVWQADAPTVALAEGFLMYLTEEEVTRFLSNLRGCVGAGSRLVFSYLIADRQGRPDIGRGSLLNRTVLRVMGEPLRWAVRNWAQLEATVGAAAFELLGPPEQFHLATRYLAPLGRKDAVGELERFAVAGTVPPA